MLTQVMHQCEFCRASFYPRPQVKNPRACLRSECQRKRQRSNELEWRKAHSTQSDPQYHRIRKLARLKQLRALSEWIGRCVETGARFLKKSFSFESTHELLLQFLVSLGIRKINKFWPRSFVQMEQGVI